MPEVKGTQVHLLCENVAFFLINIFYCSTLIGSWNIKCLLSFNISTDVLKLVPQKWYNKGTMGIKTAGSIGLFVFSFSSVGLEKSST